MEQPTSPLDGADSEMDFSMSVCSPEAMAYSLFEDRETPSPAASATTTSTAPEIPIPPPPPPPPVPVNLPDNRTASVIMSAFPFVTIPQTSVVTPTLIQVQQIQPVPQTRLTLQPIQTPLPVQQTLQQTITPQQLQQLTLQQQAQLQLQQQLQQQGLRIQGQPQLVLTQAQNQPVQQVQLQQQQPQQQQQQMQMQMQTQQQLLQRHLLEQQQQKQALRLQQQQQQPVTQQLQTVQQQLQLKKQQRLHMQQAQIAQQGQQIQVQQGPAVQAGQQLQLQQLQQQQIQQQIQQQQQMQQHLLQQQQSQHQQQILQQQQLQQQQQQGQLQLQQQQQEQLQQQKQQEQEQLQQQLQLQQQQQQQQQQHEQLKQQQQQEQQLQLQQQQHEQLKQKQQQEQQLQQQQRQHEQLQQQLQLQRQQQHHEQLQQQLQQLLQQQQQQLAQGQCATLDQLDQEARSPQHSVEDDSITENLEKKKDVLALRLKLRRPREELVGQGIMPPLKASPGFHEQRQRLERAKVGDSLQRKIRLRPEKSHLVNQHILADTHVDPLVNATQQRLKRSRLQQDLDSKIKNRPGPLELIEGNILKAEHLVEQAVKDGKVKFLKTNSLETNPFEFDEDSQEGFSDEALSPSQSEISQAESQLSAGSLPMSYSTSALGDPSKTSHAQQQQQQQQQQQHHYKQTQQRSSVTSPSQLLSPKAVKTFITIKQEPGLISPPPISSSSFTPISAVSNINLSSSGKVTPSPRQPRKKQTKRPNKPKEIKFHEYKPPNEQCSKIQQQPTSTVGNPYNLLLMQQQLYLQLQLLQQQQLILPNQKHSSASTSNTPVSSTQSAASNVTVTTSAAAAASNMSAASATQAAATPAIKQQQADIKPKSTVGAKPRVLTNLDDLKVSELKLELKNRGLHVSGTKPQLVERLRQYAEKGASASSPSEVSTTSVSSSTKVSSSTDLDVPFSEIGSAPGSLSTPPISPEYRSILSVMSEPMSPGSAFDPMSPPTFQGVLTTPVCSPDTVSTTNQQTISMPGREGSPFEQTMPTLESPQPLPPASTLLSMDVVSSDIGSNTQDMMDVSSLDANTTGSNLISNDIMRQQQLKIQELEHMLKLSQMQLQQQLQQQQQQLQPLTLSQSSQQQQSPIKPSLTSLHLESPPHFENKPSAFVFHNNDLAHVVNQHPKVFSFATPPPAGQPFLFSKRQTCLTDTQGVSLPNGIVTPKAISLPSSPTERNVLGISSGMTRSITQPTFANPPPDYDEAVRQVNERKSQGNSPVGGSPIGSPPKGGIGNGDSRSTKCQDLDDLLEVLVDHGYQIPVTPKFQNVHRTIHNSSGTVTTVTQSYVRGRGGSIDLKLPAPGPSPPPMSHSYPSSDLPMEVDHADLNMSTLDIGESSTGLSGERTMRTQSVPFDIPMTTVNGCDDDITDSAMGKDCEATGSSTHADSDLNWLDLVIPSTSSGSGLTPVSTTTPPTFSMDGAFGATLGKDPFPLNLLDLSDISTPTELHHLDDDMWDNIPITE